MKGHTYLWHNEDDAKQAATLLRRQHASFVRKVGTLKNAAKLRPMGFERTDGYLMACDDLFAALQQGGKK